MGGGGYFRSYALFERSLNMPSIPLMSDIPALLDTGGWSWQKLNRPGHLSDGFWIGTDIQGGRWLTKLRGSFYAYREILFGRLAQAMNWSCQSSVFIRLDRDGAAILGCGVGDVHSAHWYMDEHVPRPCDSGCELEPLVGTEIRSIEELQPYRIDHLIDWPKSELAAYIFGGNEPSGKFFTMGHEFVIIDSEMMFSTGPCSFEMASWLKQADGTFSEIGMSLAIDVCKEISMLPTDFVAQALTVPHDISIKSHRLIEPRLRASIQFATEYAKALNRRQGSR